MGFQDVFDSAVAAHRQGRLEEAETLYSQLLAAQPGNPHVRHPLAVLRAQQGRVAEALALLEDVMAQTPSDTGLLKDYAVVLAGAGRTGDALAAFDRALALKPGDLELAQLRIEALLRLKRFTDVVAATARLLAIHSDVPILLHQRGLALMGLGRPGDAEACFARVLEIKPDFEAALHERGTALAQQHRIADWFANFQEYAQRHGASAGNDGRAPAHKARHDAEQMAWQRERGITPLSPLHIEGGERLEGPAINPRNTQDATQAWHAGHPRIVVVDNLLTDQALAALRRFCLGSNVWRTGFGAGYLGAFPEQGFSAPLLAQIAEEFQAVFADICGGMPLKYAWAFKYDSSMEGVHIHGDDAAVNVNFWITPDEANLDPASGGLLVWDVAAPPDMDFTTFNADQPAIRGFLEKSGAKAIKVPYRANRAAVFESDLFHKTDVIRFKPGYENRRINVTLLYGERVRS